MRKGIACQWNQLVDNVLDLSKTNIVPFEKAAESINNPQDSYSMFKVCWKNEDLQLKFDNLD